MIRNDEGAEKRLQEMLDEEMPMQDHPQEQDRSAMNREQVSSWDDAHEEDGVIADEYGSEAGEPGVVKVRQVHGNNPVTLACANAVMKHYVSQGNMKEAWRLFWKYS